MLDYNEVNQYLDYKLEMLDYNNNKLKKRVKRENLLREKAQTYNVVMIEMENMLVM